VDRINIDDWSEVLRFAMLSAQAGKMEVEAREDTCRGKAKCSVIH